MQSNLEHSDRVLFAFVLAEHLPVLLLELETSLVHVDPVRNPFVEHPVPVAVRGAYICECKLFADVCVVAEANWTSLAASIAVLNSLDNMSPIRVSLVTQPARRVVKG